MAEAGFYGVGERRGVAVGAVGGGCVRVCHLFFVTDDSRFLFVNFQIPEVTTEARTGTKMVCVCVCFGCNHLIRPVESLIALMPSTASWRVHQSGQNMVK